MSKAFSARCGGVMFVAGTRPELIKIAPVVRIMARQQEPELTIVSTAQQADLVPTFLGLLGAEVDYCLNAMSPGQSLNALLAKTVAALDPVIEAVQPVLVVVQGDTTSALAGALAARMRGVPVAHIEAGLRTGDRDNPFPEETNRHLVSHLASLHFAPTARNRDQLLSEGIPADRVLVTGNPIVASLQRALAEPNCCLCLEERLAQLSGLKPIVVTTHRRESVGEPMRRNLLALRDFVATHRDTALIIPVHLNPRVEECVKDVLEGAERVALIEPLDYPCFLRLLQSAWLVVSDSGGIQEEVASLGKALLVLRRVTERPEAVESGIARLAGEWPGQLESLLADRPALTRWIEAVGPVANPFGDAQSPGRIAAAITDFFVRQSRLKAAEPKSAIQ